MTSLLLRLSGEHPQLPKKEAVHLFRAYDPEVEYSELPGRRLVVETDLDSEAAVELCLRLAMTTAASEVLCEFSSPQDLDLPIGKLAAGATFAVRRDPTVDADQELESEVGAALLDLTESSGINLKVDLECPDNLYLISDTEDGYLLSLSLKKPSRSRFRRRSDERPFKKPISLDPLLARAMVNMSGVKPGERVLDPFCGTGNILVEAGLIGASIFGIDSDFEIVRGALENLNRLQQGFPHLVRGDALRANSILDCSFQHIVTDPPYGRASPATTDTTKLIRGFVSIAPRILAPWGSICITCPSTLDLTGDLSEAGLRVDDFVYQRVHRSLGRHLYLATRPG